MIIQLVKVAQFYKRKFLNQSPPAFSLPGRCSPRPCGRCNQCRIVPVFHHRLIQVMGGPRQQSVIRPSPAKASRPYSMGSTRSRFSAIFEQDIYFRMLEKYVLLCFREALYVIWKLEARGMSIVSCHFCISRLRSHKEKQKINKSNEIIFGEEKESVFPLILPCVFHFLHL